MKLKDPQCLEQFFLGEPHAGFHDNLQEPIENQTLSL